MITLNRKEKINARYCGLIAAIILTATCISSESSLLIAYGQDTVSLTAPGEGDKGSEQGPEKETVACIVEEPSNETNDTNSEQKEDVAELTDNNAVEFEYAEPTLSDKYSYALYDTSGNRNDITEDLLQVLETSCNQWGVNPNLMLGIIMTESEGHSYAKNSKSTATGMCQILRGTGKYIYEDLLGNGKGTYNHQLAYDPATNVQMGVAYMGTLIKQRGSVYKAIQSYRGKTNVSGYVGKINSYMAKAGLSVDSL